MSGRFDDARPLAFMHVPKSAGTSLIAGLFDAIRPTRFVSGFDPVLFGDFDDFGSFSKPTRDVIFSSPACMPGGDLVTGHIALSTLRARYPSAQVMTLLREPQSRLLSHWLFWRGHDDKRLEDWGSWADSVRLARLPLGAFLGSRVLACQNDNVLVRMLLWPHPLIPTGDFIDARHDSQLLGDSRAHLASLDFVGIVEDDGLHARLQHWLGRPFTSQRRNRTSGLDASLQGSLDAELDRETFDRLERLSRIDAQLWSDLAASGQSKARRMDRHQQFVRSVARHAVLMAGG